MNIETFQMEKEKAKELWQDYNKAIQEHPLNGHLKDMKACYNQLKSGRKLIDIQKVIKRGGIDAGDPNLAIARADWEGVEFHYEKTRIAFTDNSFSGWACHEGSKRLTIRKLPEIPTDWCDKYGRENQYDSGYRERTTMLPAIPAPLLPKGSLKKYWILWEVDEWKMIPPKDPWLLKKLTPNIFVVLAGWDLTELERSVIAGRMS